MAGRPRIGTQTRVPHALGDCDIVGVEWSYQRVSERMLRRQNAPIGPPGRVAILQLVPDEESGRSIGIDQLSAETKQPIERVARELKSLMSENS